MSEQSTLIIVLRLLARLLFVLFAGFGLSAVAAARLGIAYGAVSYTLDKVGNRQSRVSSVPSVPSVLSQTYTARDWNIADTYDLNGNTLTSPSIATGSLLLTPDSFADTYDFENRLILRLKSDGTQINVSYDADGNRVQKSVLDSSSSLLATHYYLVDTNNLTGYSQVLEERTTTYHPGPIASDQRTVAYTYGADLISRTLLQPSVLQPSVAWFVYDGHGSVRELTDESGAVTETYTYDAFGVLTASTSPSSSDFNPYRYCGEQWDFDLGLYFNRARYLNPNSGRFWSMDTYEGSPSDPASLHKYLYANADPVGMFDPSGNFSLGEVMTSVGVIGTLTGMANIGIAAMGTSLAMADADGVPDAAIFSASEVGATRGVSGSIGFDIIYHFKTRKFYGYIDIAAGLSPLSYFKNFRNSLSSSITGGLIWNMNSPDEWSGGGMTGTWPASAGFLLARAMGRTNPMWGALSQLAKRETNVKWSDYVVQVGVSTSGPAALKFGLRNNSFSAEASWGFAPVDLSVIGSEVINRLGINLAALESGDINSIMGELR